MPLTILINSGQILIDRMRILLDSRDLIDLLEHQQPTTAVEFDAYLRAGNHQIVQCFTNVRELCGPLGAGAEFLRVRPFLQALDQMPHACLKEAMIVAFELQSAVDAFNAHVEYRDYSPYVNRWDFVLGREDPVTANWPGLRLDDIVYFMSRARPDIFTPQDQHLAALRAVFDGDRILLRAGRLPARQNFKGSIGKHAATHGIHLPDGHENEFAEWVYSNPNRCPGLRLAHELYRAVLANYGDQPEVGDFSDWALIYAIPYVDAITLDRRMRHYCASASRKMFRFGAAHNYNDRVYENVAFLMAQDPHR
jgi:hypothetical protein